MNKLNKKYFSLSDSNIPYILIIIILNVIFFFNFITLINYVISYPGTDTGLYFYSWRAFKSNVIAQGELPLWNPYTFSGTPAWASAQNDLLYPLSFLYLIFPTGYAINLNIFLCFCFSGIFMFYLARSINVTRIGSLASGLIYNFSSYIVLHTFSGHITIIQILPLAPLFLLSIFKLIEKRKFICVISSSFILSLMIFAGHTQYVYYASLIAIFTLVYVISAELFCKKSFIPLIVVRHLCRTFMRDKSRPTSDCLNNNHREISSTIKTKPFCFFQKDCLRLVFYFILIFILSGLFSSIQLLPTYEFTQNSIRTESLSYEFIKGFSFPPRHLITFLLPDFYGDVVNVPYWSSFYFWEMCVYSGIGTLFLAVIGLLLKKNKWAIYFAVLGLFGLIFGFGGYSPLFRLLYNFLPGMKLFRGHTKFMFVVIMSLSILAGIGISNISEEMSSQMKKRLILILLVLLILFSIFFISIFYLYHFGKGDNEFWQKFVVNTLNKDINYFNSSDLKSYNFFDNARNISIFSFYRTLIITLIFIILFAIFVVMKRLRRVIIIFIVMMLFIDLFLYNNKFLVGSNENNYKLQNKIVEVLKKDGGNFRVATVLISWLNRPMQYSIYDVCGYDSNILLRYNEYMNFIQGLPSSNQHLVTRILRLSPLLLQSFGIKYFILPSDASLDSGVFQTVLEDKNFKLVKINVNIPRTAIIRNVILAKNKEEAQKLLLENKGDYFSQVVLETNSINETDQIKFPVEKDLSNNKIKDYVEITNYSINSVSIKAKLDADGYLFLSDVYYPGWKVKIDGEKEKIYRANYLFRAVYLDKGEHNVYFYFQPSSFIIGAMISFLMIVFYIFYLIYYFRKMNFFKRKIDVKPENEY